MEKQIYSYFTTNTTNAQLFNATLRFNQYWFVRDLLSLTINALLRLYLHFQILIFRLFFYVNVDPSITLANNISKEILGCFQMPIFHVFLF